ncbi:MAG: 1,4-alpha-glucan branching protein domain-containing protein [bacterium]
MVKIIGCSPILHQKLNADNYTYWLKNKPVSVIISIRKLKMPKGYLSFILHAHLPYVRHPEYDDFLEERWFFEAITETYIPLIKFFHRLAEEDVNFKLTISISPSLLAMMEDPLLQERYLLHINKLIELSEKELERNRHNSHLNWLAGMYRQLFLEAREIYLNQWNCKLSSAFKRLHKCGAIELITTSATHGLLPLLSPQPKSVNAQVITGLDYFEGVFGFRPKGMWLPECGYYPGLDKILWDEGVGYFILESHGVEYGSTNPFYGVYAPIYTPSGVAAFGRDQSSTKQVWSAKEGFPGHPDYREFYRDIGHDLDFNYLHPYLSGNVRVDTGIKYYRITGQTTRKGLYNPEIAKERAAQHAGEFLHKRISHVEYLISAMKTNPIVIAPFDAELFGHWWFEGPQWLDFVIRKTIFDQDTIELITPSDYLDSHPVHQKGIPSTSTWGHKGYFEAWLNGKTDWIYPQLHECSRKMEVLANKFSSKENSTKITQRALNQCLRELLLAQSSDWPFIINNSTSTDYATRRVKDHVARFHYLASSIENNSLVEENLSAIEYMDNIFPKADYRLFKRQETKNQDKTG